MHFAATRDVLFARTPSPDTEVAFRPCRVLIIEVNRGLCASTFYCSTLTYFADVLEIRWPHCEVDAVRDVVFCGDLGQLEGALRRGTLRTRHVQI